LVRHRLALGARAPARERRDASASCLLSLEGEGVHLCGANYVNSS
jgi:hypothetical protein